MLEVFAKIICASMMSITGFYIIKRLLDGSNSIINIKTLVSLIILTTISLFIRPIQYTGLYTITIFIMNIFAYKVIFDLSIEEATVCVGILMTLIFASDLITSIFFRMFYTISEIRSNLRVLTISNFVVCMIGYSFMEIKYIRNQLNSFYKNLRTKKSLMNLIFFIILIVGFSSLAYKITSSIDWKTDYLVNIVIMVVFMVISYIYIKSKNSYGRLIYEYDNLFNYIQNFEEWIEREQLNRHEYKNQLAVLRCLTKDKKVKNKIDEILEDNINLEGETVQQLKDLPKGGLKGLMYYKTIIAQKSKIKLTFDVSIERKSIINKLTEKQMNTLCKLIGIYFDNAIEASSETRKKNILVEVYDLKNRVNIVISNTFKKGDNFDNRNEKGISTKGEGRGNGLYFANKLLSKNNWLEQTQEIVDEYYIQKLTIKKLER